MFQVLRTCEHFAINCKVSVTCRICKSKDHPTALHVDRQQASTADSHEGESTSKSAIVACTKICGKPAGTSRSCAKVVLVKVHREDEPHNYRTLYAMIDDQATASLAKSDFFDRFGETGPEEGYLLRSCSGEVHASGRRASGYVVRALDDSCGLKLPQLIECDNIPNIRDEIPTPEVAELHSHMRDISRFILPLDENSDIELLIGRDLISAHHVLDHRMGHDSLPYAQKLPLGWVVIGEVCLGKVHRPEISNVNKTFVLHDGRTTLMEPCTSNLRVDPVFHKTKDDEKPGLSVEDRQFLDVMDSEFSKDSGGNWVAPLPFRVDRSPLPNNRSHAAKRAKSLDFSLRKDPVKRNHMVDFMQNVLDSGHAELALPLSEGTECWYLPLFGVYHPKKPGRVRVVFDSSARFEGISLNDVLLKGPDLTNSLLGVLIRFRREAVAITADIEQMFHNFRVKEEHKDFLRFLWYQDNNPDLPLVEYRMTVHVFGNSPSPAVATYGLRKSVEDASPDVKDFVTHDFYVDDGLTSCANSADAADLMKRSQQALKEGGNLRLHKIASNSTDVLDNFPPDDLAKELKGLDLSVDTLPSQRSLGLTWDIASDAITYQVSNVRKPFTRRGVLSTTVFLTQSALRLQLRFRANSCSET